MIRVLVVDDHKLVRAGIGQLLAETDDIEVVGEAGDGHEALEAVALLHPDVLLGRRGKHETGDLTEREMDVLVLLADGLPNKVIATRLGIAEKTVKAHITQIFQALGVSDRTQAALWVDRHGLSPHWQARR